MLSPEEKSFLDSIHADPTSFDLWSIYVDWLEEQNDPRASLFRQHEMGPMGSRLAYVPAGTFWMSRDYQNAQRKVNVPHDFHIGVHPVTQAEWVAVMGENPSHFSPLGKGHKRVAGISREVLARLPVEQISWTDTQRFLQRLNEREKNPVMTYRLPTEAEWEYACRGGATSKEDCSFDFYFSDPTNDLSSEKANFDGNYPFGNGSRGPYLERTTVVGSYEPNALGIYDLHGNVWEWCQDLTVQNLSSRIIRGGSWYNIGERSRASFRRHYEPSYSSSFLGFRLVRSSS